MEFYHILFIEVVDGRRVFDEVLDGRQFRSVLKPPVAFMFAIFDGTGLKGNIQGIFADASDTEVCKVRMCSLNILCPVEFVNKFHEDGVSRSLDLDSPLVIEGFKIFSIEGTFHVVEFKGWEFVSC